MYYGSVHAKVGRDTVEPVTYIAGLTAIMGGYLWLMYISRDVSYNRAINATVSRRQNTLYEARAFDIARWSTLVRDANRLRAEIRKGS